MDFWGECKCGFRVNDKFVFVLVHFDVFCFFFIIQFHSDGNNTTFSYSIGFFLFMSKQVTTSFGLTWIQWLMQKHFFLTQTFAYLTSLSLHTNIVLRQNLRKNQGLFLDFLKQSSSAEKTSF